MLVQVPVQHDLLPATAAQAAVVPVSSLSPQLLQRFQAGSHLNTAGKQAALEELVLAIAEAG